MALGRGWGRESSAGASDGFPAQLLFKQHSLSHSSASLCKLFESRVCLYAHLLSEGGCSMANSCLGIAHFDVSIFILGFFLFFFLDIVGT